MSIPKSVSGTVLGAEVAVVARTPLPVHTLGAYNPVSPGWCRRLLKMGFRNSHSD